jgi:hypothetical protein
VLSLFSGKPEANDDATFLTHVAQTAQTIDSSTQAIDPLSADVR